MRRDYEAEKALLLAKSAPRPAGGMGLFLVARVVIPILIGIAILIALL